MNICAFSQVLSAADGDSMPDDANFHNDNVAVHWPESEVCVS